MFDNMSVKTRLVASRLLIIVVILAFTAFTIIQIRSMAETAHRIYEHPLRVSNASMTASWNATRMHRSMKDVVLSKNDAELEEAIAAVDIAEHDVFEQLDIVREYILGEEGKRLENETRELILQWMPIRQEVINLVKAGKIDEAASITKGKGYLHYEKIVKKKSELNSYARNKADTFIAEVKRQENQTTTLILTITALLIIS